MLRLSRLVSALGHAVITAPLLLSMADASAETLMQVYRDALANDPIYAGARALYQANLERVPQARAGLLPNLGLTGSLARSQVEAGLQPPLPDVNYSVNQRAYTLALTQPLFNWQNFETYEQAKISVAIYEGQFAQAQQDLLLRVAQAYFDVLAARDSLAFTGTQKTAISEQLASAKRNFEVGTATITDSNEAQSRYDLAVAQEIAAENDLQVKTAALRQLMGRAATELAPLRTDVQLPAPTPNAIDPWVDAAERGNLNVRIARANSEVAKREISRARGGYYPTIDAVASRSYNRSPSVLSQQRETTSNQIGVQLSVPLFAGFATQARVREAISLEDQARQNVENATRTAAQGARSAYLGVTNGLAQVRALEAAERSSQTSLEANQLGYRVGVRVNIDVLNAQQQLFQTRRDLSRSRYDTVLGALRLKQASGQLAEKDLQEIDALLAR